MSLNEGSDMPSVALRCLIRLVVAVMLVPAFGRGSFAAVPAQRPNILFIFCDDHAAHAMSCYGSRINKTPNLDRIAAGGMLFRNCFCTNSVCGPSRATILTGKFSHQNGFYRNGDRFDGSQQTFPKLLQAAGYQTAMIGKWHLESDPTGFEQWKILIGQGTYYNPVLIENGKKVTHTGYVTDILTDRALDFLKNARDPSKPFLLMYQHKAPHREWEPSPAHLTLFDDVTIPEPETLFDDYRGRGSPAHTQEMQIARHLNDRDLKLVPPKNLNPDQLEKWNAAYEPKNRAFRERHLSGRELVRWKYQRYIKDYLRCVASVDENVGRVLDYLDASGLAKNTIVVYSSDQGFYLGDHGWFDKRFMYEESYRMPFLVRWPGVAAPGRTSEALVSNLDFAETFLEAAGASIPADMQGKSLVPLLAGGRPSDWRTSLYYHYYEYPAVHMVQKHYGVRTPRHKLIHFYEIDEWELYDLQADPREMRSVYADPAYAPVVAELKTELKRLRDVYQVPAKDPVNPRAARPRRRP
jgi:arylsulfatase A-like enzyme